MLLFVFGGCGILALGAVVTAGTAFAVRVAKRTADKLVDKAIPDKKK